MNRASWTDFAGEGPSLDDFVALAEAALAEIPQDFKRHIEGVALRIDDWPDEATLRQMRISHPLGLLGLYRGLPIGFKQAGAVVKHVDMIFLYRQPILAYWRARGGKLRDMIRHVLVHEIGHHFGLSDDDMERIEAEAE
jgi:predicted Zn-dependent protease with MMP-like domain